MRDQLRAWTAGYVLSAIIVMAWPDRSGWTNLTVLALWLFGVVAGERLWVTIVERRRWWAIDIRSRLRAIDIRSRFWEILLGDSKRRTERRAFRRLKTFGLLLLWFAAFVATSIWPIAFQVPVDAQGAPIPPTVYYFDHIVSIDLPENAARVLIVVSGVYWFTIALGNLILSVAEARRSLNGHAQPLAS